MSENLIICGLAAYALLAVLFIAEGLYRASAWLLKRWKGILKLVVVAGLLGASSQSRADTLLTITGTGIVLGSDTLNFSIPFDLTKMKELHGAVFSFASGFDGNLRFDASRSGPDLFNFYDKTGDHLQIGESDYFRTAYPGYNFPDLGIYPARLVNFECFTCSAGYLGFNNGTLGFVSITDPPDPTPEPMTIVLICCGLLYFLVLRLPKRKL